MRKLIVSGVAAAAAVVLAAGPVLAHSEWEPSTAVPGSVVDLTLFVEDEMPDAGTNKVELTFPQPITVAALPEVPGWTATLVDGELGGPASGVTWSGGPQPDDVELPITLGPLPNEPGRLQFKVVQTYDNGDVDRWIDDWVEGQPEPESPGPVLDLVGESAATTTTTTAPETTATTADSEPSTTLTPTTTAGDQDDDEDSDGSALPVVIGGVVVLAGAVGAFVYLRSRRSSGA